MRERDFRICPECGGIMELQTDVHTELDSYPREQVWWECDYCGRTMNLLYDDEDVGYTDFSYLYDEEDR